MSNCQQAFPLYNINENANKLFEIEMHKKFV